MCADNFEELFGLKRNPEKEGRIKVICTDREIGGFAIQLLQL